MALVGVIGPGTIERVLRSVAYAHASVLVLLVREQQLGNVLFEEGEIVTARLDDLRDRDALEAMRQWTSGHYTLVKRGADEDDGRGHFLLNGLAVSTRQSLERWLTEQGHHTSIVGYPEHALQIMSFLRPDVLLTSCPRAPLGLSCVELADRLRQEMHVAPLILVVEDPEQPCAEPTPSCHRTTGEAEELRALLARDWPDTRYGVRRAVIEDTAKIPIPRRHSSTEEVLARVVAEPQPVPRTLNAADCLLPLGILLLGSSLIWIAYYAIQR